MYSIIRIGKRRAVSPVIAVVLMIAVAVAITAVVFAWSSGLVTERTSARASDPEQIIVEEMNFSGTVVTVYLRNKELYDTFLDAIYVNGQLRARNINMVISANRVSFFNLSDIITASGGDGTFYTGDIVQLVTSRGTQIRFHVRN